MMNFIFILLFSFTSCTHHLFGMDNMIHIPIEGGEIFDDLDIAPHNSDGEIFDSLDEPQATPKAMMSAQIAVAEKELLDTVDEIANQIDAKIRKDNPEGMKRKEIFVRQKMDYTCDMLARVQENSVQDYDLQQIIENGLLRKLRTKNPLFDRALTDSVRYFHKKFAEVTPETLDFIDHPKFQTNTSFNQLAEPIKTYIMQEAKNSQKSHCYWLANYESPDKKIKKYNCHNVYMCRLAIKNAKKAVSLPQIYGSHQFKESTEYEQNMIRQEIEKLAPRGTTKPLSPTIKY